MPCRSDYLEPTRREFEGHVVCYFLCEIANLLNSEKYLSDLVKKGASSLYGVGVGEDVDFVTDQLCRVCKELERTNLGRMIMKHIAITDSRVTRRSYSNLGNWWVSHKEADRKRKKEKMNNDKKERAKLEFEKMVAEKMRLK